MKIKMNLKNVVAILMLLVVMVSFSYEPVQAANSWKQYSTYTYSTGILWWKKTYNCKVYVEQNYDWYMIFYGNAKVSTGFEYKPNKKSSIVLQQTKSFSIDKQDVDTLNSNLEVEAYGIKAGIGGSKSQTSAQTWGVSNTSVRTVDAQDPNGYYSYNVLINTKYIKVTGTADGTIYLSAPNSEPYRAIVYNKNNASYSGAKKDY